MKTHAGSDRARRAAIRLLRWYPRPWQARYRREMQAMLEDMPVGWKQVWNLGGAAVREWLSPRAFGWPARSAAGRMQTVRTLTFMACAYSLDAIARAVAWILTSVRFEVTETMRVTCALIALALAIRVLLEGSIRLGKKLWAARARERFSWLLEMRDLEIALWAVAIFPSLVAHYAETPPSYLSPAMVAMRPFIHLIQVYVWTWMTLQSSNRTIRLRHVQSSYLRRPWTHWRSDRTVGP